MERGERSEKIAPWRNISGEEEHHGMSELQRPLLIITPTLYSMVEELSNRKKCQLPKYISAGTESGVKPRPLHFLLFFFFLSSVMTFFHTVKLSPSSSVEEFDE